MERQMKQLSSKYLYSEEVAFKNALLFYSKHLYECGYISSDGETHSYYSTPPRQRPFVEELHPKIRQYLINNDAQNVGLEDFDLIEDHVLKGSRKSHQAQESKSE